MSKLGRRAFTLVELLVVMVILGIVSAGLLRTFIGTQRNFSLQSERSTLQQNLRAAATVIPTDLRLLDAVDGDIYAMASDSLKIRAMRVMAVICDAPTLGGTLTGRTITVRTAKTFGARAISTTTDSLLLFYEGNANIRDDDGWVRAKPTAVSSVNCTDGSGGTRITADFAAFVSPFTNTAGMVPVGVPLWAWETITYRSYQAADGFWYMGMRTSSGLNQLLGPLDGSGGLVFSYFDAAGNSTTTPANVRTIRMQMRVRSPRTVFQVGSGAVTPIDSMSLSVALRNNARY
jgi:prepilin-type N-terminal cleavage/methylation domain-containing protein